VPHEDVAVLFVCEHGAAKSVLAAELLQLAAAAQRLRVVVRAAGIEPSAEIADGVLTLLPEQAAALQGRTPRRVTAADLDMAAITVTFNLDPADLPARPRELLAWDDVPPVAGDPVAARAVIDGHIAELIDRLRS
jgi:arsenate reductase